MKRMVLEEPRGTERVGCFGLDVTDDLADIALGMLNQRVDVIAQNHERMKRIWSVRDCFSDDFYLLIAETNGRELQGAAHLALEVAIVRLVRDRAARVDLGRGTKA